MLEKRDRGMLWCKVPKAASESWTGLFIKQWYGRKAKQLMWRQQVANQPVSKTSLVRFQFEVLLHSVWAPHRRSAAYIKAISHTHFSFLTSR